MVEIICNNRSGSSERLKMGPIGPARDSSALSADGLGSSRIDSGLSADGLEPSRMDFGAKQERPTPCPRMCGVKRRPFICFSWLFCLLPSSFLALMQEKKQKKIKASGTPAKFGGVPDGDRPNWSPSAILDVPGQTSLPSAEGF